MLQTKELGTQIIHYAACLPQVAEGLRPFLLAQATRLAAEPTIPEREKRKASAALNAVLASPMCEGLVLDKTRTFDYSPETSEVRFDSKMYAAALAYYGLPTELQTGICQAATRRRARGNHAPTCGRNQPGLLAPGK
jgi:hypothetical protein